MARDGAEDACDLGGRGLDGQYLCLRPHQGLLGATPAEAFLGVEPISRRAVKPPRGRVGEGPADPSFVIDFLDPEKRSFPFLKAA